MDDALAIAEYQHDDEEDFKGETVLEKHHESDVSDSIEDTLSYLNFPVDNFLLFTFHFKG